MKKDVYELTNPQKSIWLTEEFYKGTAINNICGNLIIREKVDFENFKKAINLFVKTNESFRLKFFIEDSTPKQYVSDFAEFDLEIIDLNSEDDILKLQKETASEVFEIIDSLLFKFQIIRLPDGSGGFIVNAHHLISDAATFAIIATEIVKIYSSLISKTEFEYNTNLYTDYIKSEQEYLQSEKFKKDETYWNELYKEVPEVATIPSLLNKNDKNSNDSLREDFIIPKELFDKINTVCKENRISSYNLFMAIYAIYLGRVSNLNEFVIGTPILNRTNFVEKNTSGMFISTASFKINLNHELSFADFAKKIATDSLSMLRHQKYPYQFLLENLRKQSGHIPNLYDFMFSYQITKATDKNLEVPYTTHWTGNDKIANSLEVHAHDNDSNGTVTIGYDYKTEKYTKEDITNLHNRVLCMLEQIISNPNILLKDIEIVTPEEKHKILYEFNDTKVDYPKDKTIVQLFEEQVEKTPDNIAVVFEDQKLTYKELNEKANQLAIILIHNGVMPNDRICLFFNNSIELVVAILAILKCGACYIPIDVSYPEERILYIFNNSCSKKILANNKNSSKLQNISKFLLTIDLDELNNLNEVTIDKSNIKDSAYIIYTSGSTGNPKGVEISNRNLVHYIYWAKKYYVGDEVTNFPLYSSISFDLTVTSVFTPLISGYTIYIYENENPQLLLQQIILDGKVQIIKLTPAHLILLYDCIKGKTSVSKLIVGGDILNREICSKISEAFNGKIKIYNEYGPTETTVGCMIYQYNKNDNYSSVPIGVPIDNINIYILDKNLNLLPYGCPGEIYISGDGVCKGYFNNETLSEEKLIDNPFCKNSKIYKTGDIAKMYSNGIIEYIGRSDFQVKINGYRIELGEIQSKLLSYPNIKDCYVTVLEIDKLKAICAYYVSNESIDVSSLKHFLSSYLPAYMIPKHYINLDKIPLTFNGKPNKSKLPIPTVNKKKIFVEPKTKLQKILHDIMCQLLNISNLSITTDFFDFLIDSLTIIKAQALLYSRGYNVNTQAFYEHSNIKDLEKHILLKSESTTKSLDTDILDIKEIQHKLHIKIPSHKNILLFGATGFLGIHILYNLLIDTDYNIYCIIREKDNMNSKQRITESLNFYFKDLKIKDYADRLNIISGDLLKSNFGVSDYKYTNLGKNIDCVIDTAAIVKHYGDYKLFHDLNVLGTKRVINFCTKYNIPLHYVSTLSVSGYGLVNCPKSTFTENDFFIGQSYMDNVYVRSKFEAEKLILDSCKDENLIANIYRVGNITNRFSDGYFQKNYFDNAFINRLTAFINLRIYTK